MQEQKQDLSTIDFPGFYPTYGGVGFATFELILKSVRLNWSVHTAECWNVVLHTEKVMQYMDDVINKHRRQHFDHVNLSLCRMNEYATKLLYVTAGIFDNGKGVITDDELRLVLAIYGNLYNIMFAFRYDADEILHHIDVATRTINPTYQLTQDEKNG